MAKALARASCITSASSIADANGADVSSIGSTTQGPSGSVSSSTKPTSTRRVRAARSLHTVYAEEGRVERQAL